jgi:hypothetical protein
LSVSTNSMAGKWRRLAAMELGEQRAIYPQT